MKISAVWSDERVDQIAERMIEALAPVLTEFDPTTDELMAALLVITFDTLAVEGVPRHMLEAYIKIRLDHLEKHKRFREMPASPKVVS